jgi:WD40 repeat protein
MVPNCSACRGGGKPQAIYLQFSPDGRFLAERFLGETTSLFRVWDLERGKVVLQPLVAVHNFVVKFTPDSERIALIEVSGLLHLFQLDGGLESGTFMTLSVPNDLCFDSTATRLAVCSEANRMVRVFAMNSGMLAQEIEQPAGVHGLSWHPQGHLLACAGMDHNVYLWNVLNGTCTAVLIGHTGSVTGLTFNRRGDLLVSTGWDGQCRFWDPVLGVPLLSLPGAFVPRFSPDDSELGFNIPPRAGVWRVATAPECRRLGLVGPIVPGNCAAFNRDGRLLAAATRDGTRVWDLERNREIAQLPTGDSRSVIFHPKDQSLITSGAAGMQRWVVRTDPVAGTFQVGSAESIWTSAVEHACLSDDGQTLVAVRVSGPYADALVLDLERPDKPVLLNGHPASTWLAIHPDGNRFASGNWKGTGVRIWDAKTGAPMKDLACGENVSVAFSPDGPVVNDWFSDRIPSLGYPQMAAWMLRPKGTSRGQGRGHGLFARWAHGSRGSLP